MSSLCSDAKDRTASSKARLANGFAALYSALARTVELWKQGDFRVVYRGYSLKETLRNAFAAKEQACTATSEGIAGTVVADIYEIARRLPQTDVQSLIAGMDDSRMLAGMAPVGY